MAMSEQGMTDHILHTLARHGPMNFSQLLAAVPELVAESHAAEMLRLLLRLDRRLRLLDDGRWTLASTPQTPEQRIVSSAQSYLDAIPGEGALLKSVVEHVAGETGFADALVRSAILRSFENNGTVVRNKRKGAP